MKSWARESSNIRKDGSVFPVRLTSDVVLDARGECVAIVSTCEDITERKQVEQAILDRLRLQDRLAKISATVPGMIYTLRVRPDGVMSMPYASPTMDKIFGLTPESVIDDAAPAFSLIHPDDIDLVRETIATSARTMNPWQKEFRVHHPHKGEIWIEGHSMPQEEPDGSIFWHGFMHDVTERKRYELELKHQAGHDTLTGLANRNLMADRLLQNTIHAWRSRQNIGIMLLDLDRFKMVNDSMGHNYGDELLQQVADRLVNCVRAGDTVCRMGGDEFVIILSELVEEDNIGLLAKRIHETLAEPFSLSDHQLRITVSIGISLFPKDGELVETLIRNADIAMYRAKEEGGDKFRFFAPEMNARIQGILELEEEMHQAIQKSEFVMYYQPQIDLASGRIVGCEALLRWRHPTRGMFMPGNFIPLAEESGMIIQLGHWVLQEVCTQARAWQDEGLPMVKVAVNLSAKQFRQHDLIEQIQAILLQTGLAPSVLELELTESVLIHDPTHAIQIMNHLKQLGISLSLDDFGTGYSSLNYLRHFPLNSIKIDRSFIKDMAQNTNGAVLSKSIVTIAHSLGLKAIAEGVESWEQHDFLASCGCNELQGFLFSEPLPPDEFAEFLREKRCLHRKGEKHGEFHS
jgi:diguanylate cyclase (GGDEF)-like protein/PAS domain S-box-containing protein